MYNRIEVIIMKKFIDRQSEIASLEREYHRESAAMVVVYGRRRVGKTTLISEFIKNKEALYFLATEESESQNIRAFKDMVADFTNNSLLKNATVSNWEDIFRLLAEYKPAQRKVIIIDEFQYLGKATPSFPSVFQKIWDTVLINANVMVILCGSLITMMEAQTLSYSSPLYGRRTGQIRLKPIPFQYFHEFFPGKSHKQLVEIYSIAGGIPKYIELFNTKSDIYDAITRNILDTSNFLFDEPNFLLQREVNEIGSYFSIIKVIAAGNHKLSKISTVLEQKQTGLTKYLKTLIDLDILEREVPITEESPEKSKKGLYKIKDHFIAFWFQFIYPNISYIESGNQKIAIEKIRNNLIDGHISYVYEDICKEKMWQLNANDAWSFNFDKVGRWWDNNGNEIDIVALDQSGNNLILGECKFWKDPVGVNILLDLEKKARLVDWKIKDRSLWYVLFSINGYTQDLIDLAGSRPDVLLSE